MNDCIFCKIIRGEIPSRKVYEDDSFFVFLDIHPINPGHILIIPKQHMGDVFDLDDPLFADAFKLAKMLAPKLKEAAHAPRTGLAIEGFGVDHAHIHLVPIHGPNELNPERAKEASAEDLDAMAENLREKFR